MLSALAIRLFCLVLALAGAIDLSARLPLGETGVSLIVQSSVPGNAPPAQLWSAVLDGLDDDDGPLSAQWSGGSLVLVRAERLLSPVRTSVEIARTNAQVTAPRLVAAHPRGPPSIL